MMYCKKKKKEIYLFPLERVLLLKLLLVLILVHQDEVDPPHAVVEEQGVLLVVELGLWAKTRLTGELCCLIFIDLFLHNVIHGEQREREREREEGLRADGTVQRNCCVRHQQSTAYLSGDEGHAGEVGRVDKHHDTRPSSLSPPLLHLVTPHGINEAFVTTCHEPAFSISAI